MRHIIFIIGIILTMSCINEKTNDKDIDIKDVQKVQEDSLAKNEEKDIIKIKKTYNLIIYYPIFDSIDLVCGNMPSKSDSSVIFCASASFTEKLLNTFNHKNISGNHVSSGKYFEGSKYKNTGYFTFYCGKWGFHINDYNKYLTEAANKNGMGFGQNMIIYNGDMKPSFRKLSSVNKYRALCEYDGKLCIIDSKENITYDFFRKCLQKLNVKHALYLDMGNGWNHSWYRDNDLKVHEIHPRTHKYTTNWIVFKKNF